MSKQFGQFKKESESKQLNLVSSISRMEVVLLRKSATITPKLCQFEHVPPIKAARVEKAVQIDFTSLSLTPKLSLFEIIKAPQK